MQPSKVYKLNAEGPAVLHVSQYYVSLIKLLSELTRTRHYYLSLFVQSHDNSGTKMLQFT